MKPWSWQSRLLNSNGNVEAIVIILINFFIFWNMEWIKIPFFYFPQWKVFKICIEECMSTDSDCENPEFYKQKVEFEVIVILFMFISVFIFWNIWIEYKSSLFPFHHENFYKYVLSSIFISRPQSRQPKGPGPKGVFKAIVIIFIFICVIKLRNMLTSSGWVLHVHFIFEYHYFQVVIFTSFCYVISMIK